MRLELVVRHPPDAGRGRLICIPVILEVTPLGLLCTQGVWGSPALLILTLRITLTLLTPVSLRSHARVRIVPVLDVLCILLLPVCIFGVHVRTESRCVPLRRGGLRVRHRLSPAWSIWKYALRGPIRGGC
jgi:hypothetical protein